MSEKEKEKDLVVDEAMLESVESTYSAYTEDASKIKGKASDGPRVKGGGLEIKETSAEQDAASLLSELDAIDASLDSRLGSSKRKRSKEITKIKDLKPELHKAVNKLINKVAKEKVTELMSMSKVERAKLFDVIEGDEIGLTSKQKELFLDKMEEWTATKEISELNATIVVSWLDKT